MRNKTNLPDNQGHASRCRSMIMKAAAKAGFERVLVLLSRELTQTVRPRAHTPSPLSGNPLLRRHRAPRFWPAADLAIALTDLPDRRAPWDALVVPWLRPSSTDSVLRPPRH